MAEENKFLDYLKTLPLNKISEDWVKAVWESDFTEVEGLEDDVFAEVDDASLNETLCAISSCLTKLIKQSVESLWTKLGENDISLKTLQALLAYLILKGHKRHCSTLDKVIAFSAASVYLKLAQVPGSSAFSVFHPELYEKSIDFLKLIVSLGSNSGKKRKRSSLTPVKSSQGKRNKRGKKQAAVSQPEEEISDNEGAGDDGGDDDDDADSEEMAPKDVARLQKLLHSLAVDLIEFLETFSLRQSVSTGHHTVRVLAPLTLVDPDSFDGNLRSVIPKSRLSVPALAYKGLLALCSQLHGHVGTLVNATCRHLLPNLLMLVKDKPVQTISKRILTIRDIAVEFVCLLMQQCGERGHASVRTLVQQMCIKVTDRAEYRSRVAEAVIHIVHEMPVGSYCHMMQWFHKLSRHSQINNRGFAVEIVSALLNKPERELVDSVAPELRPYLRHKSLLGILLDKCSDKAPTIRGRALSCFAQCLTSGNERIAGTVREIVTPQIAPRAPHIQRLIRTPGQTIIVPADSVTTMTTESSVERSEVTIAQASAEGSTVQQTTVADGQDGKDKDTPLHRVHLTPGFDPNLSDSEGMFSMLRRRAKDEKVVVRKAALQALESAVRFEAPKYTKQNVEMITEHCRDPGLSARKQCLQSLTDLLIDFPTDAYIQKCWLNGALPLVIDRESTLSEKCMETLEELILRNVVLVIRSKSECHTLAWNLLGIIAKPESVDQRRYLQKACHHWSRQGKIKPALISALESHIGGPNDAAAWMLLAEIAPAAPKINPTFVLDYWHQHTEHDCSTEVRHRVLTVMKSVAKHLPDHDRNKLVEDLKCRLLKFNLATELISATVGTLYKLCNVQSKESGRVTVAEDWSTELLTACDKFLSKVVLEQDGISANEDLIICYLYTLGEVVQLCPGRVPKRVILVVQSMIAAPCITPHPPSQVGNQSATSQPPSENGDPLSSSQGSGFSQATQSTQPLTQFRGCTMSGRIRACAFIALGKLCLQNESLAKKCIAALARELEVSKDLAIRNNVMIVMCDLCVRYTTTANHYITNIASCLKDPSPVLRKQTLTLITRLLQEDFLKWKGPLFYRFISVLLDDSEDLQKFGEFCLLHMLIQRHPNMFFQHFMECVFHFNDYRNHTVYNQFVQSERDREMFSLKGAANVKKRHQLYMFLLDHMTDIQKFQIQSRLVQEVLGAIVDHILPMNDDTSDILKDVLKILCSKSVKLTSLKSRPNDEIAADAQEMAAIVVAVVKKTLITQVVKKNVIENIVPVVVSLKHLLEKARSPLLKDLLLYLRELMKDYKNELTEILSADRQVAAEIEYDLRKFEEEQAAANRPNVAPSVLMQPGASNSEGTTVNSPARQVVGSPRPMTPGRAPAGTPGRGPRPLTPGRVGSPRVPALRPSVLSPRPGTSSSPLPPGPVQRLMGNTATPTPKAPLSTVALLNSARRAGVEQVPRERTDSTSSEGGLPSTNATPAHVPKNVSGRAISTPSVAMSNITFHGDQNITFMPPSPIAETSGGTDDYRLILGDEDDSCTILDSEGKENEAGSDKVPSKVQKPKVWNVTSPEFKRPGRRKSKSDQSEAAADPLADIQNELANEKRVNQPKVMTPKSANQKKKKQSEEDNQPIRRQPRRSGTRKR